MHANTGLGEGLSAACCMFEGAPDSSLWGPWCFTRPAISRVLLVTPPLVHSQAISGTISRGLQAHAVHCVSCKGLLL